jgi:hypothetical protein
MGIVEQLSQKGVDTVAFATEAIEHSESTETLVERIIAPELAQRIAREILKVEMEVFERHAGVSPECRNVALRQAIEIRHQVFDKIDNKTAVVRFVKRQFNNP